MTDYELGRRDAIRDCIVRLMGRRESYYQSEPEYWCLTRAAESLEKLTCVAPDGEGFDSRNHDTPPENKP